MLHIFALDENSVFAVFENVLNDYVYHSAWVLGARAEKNFYQGTLNLYLTQYTLVPERVRDTSMFILTYEAVFVLTLRTAATKMYDIGKRDQTNKKSGNHQMNQGSKGFHRTRLSDTKTSLANTNCQTRLRRSFLEQK